MAYRFPNNGLWTGVHERKLENPVFYQPGGHHPVHLGDLLGDNTQYRVLHKLGTGGFGNVWLCRVIGPDPQEYVAVKVVTASSPDDDSTRYDNEAQNVRRLLELAETEKEPELKRLCLLPTDQFVIEGPNGSHQCLIYPVAGPPVGQMFLKAENPTKILRGLVRQAAEAMAVLHRHGICHGDFRPSNILLRLDGVNGLDEPEILEQFGHPSVTELFLVDGFPQPGASAPDYLVIPAQNEENTLASGEQLCVIDFGEAFEATSPPPGGVGIPLPYCAPEIILESGKCGFASDIWALAATMFEIRFGMRLFELFDNDPDDYLVCLVDMFGAMPEPWWSTTWRNRRSAYTDELDPEDGRPVLVHEECAGNRKTLLGLMPSEVMHFFYNDTDPNITVEVSEREMVLFEDLLKGMMRWRPEDRLSAEEVLKHPWFRIEEAEEEGEWVRESTPKDEPRNEEKQKPNVGQQPNSAEVMRNDDKSRRAEEAAQIIRRSAASKGVAKIKLEGVAAWMRKAFEWVRKS
ncbi:kinase-like domain-containing protein [Aspergillus pseudoustus]|uniref:EKC/KEOPS complex subunit BUD32 n=1 Tax=Aspergillus pseudoustus TaxID=1810923 RepID=A0ABR4K0V2_9EURO